MSRSNYIVMSMLLLAATVVAVSLFGGRGGGEASAPGPLFERLGPPELGDWRAVFEEKAQSVAAYKAEVKVRPTEGRRTIVLQPLGEMDEEKRAVMETMRAYAAVFFQLPARIAAPLALEGDGMWREAVRGNGTPSRQYDGDAILRTILEARVPEDAIAYLGVTMEDLYSGDLNYVFGVATLEKRVGVYSLCRYYPEFWGAEQEGDSALVGLRRACKVLNHEAGHMFGLAHCVAYRCSMNGSNSLPETDAAPIHFCPECEEKIVWNIGMKRAVWWGALEGFYRGNGMVEEAEWMVRRGQESVGEWLHGKTWTGH